MRNGVRKNRIQSLLTVLLAAVLLLAALPVPAAADDAAAQERYSPVLYDFHSGMPFSEARAVAQTPDGFLYIGSFGALVRYDGREFHTFDEILGVRALAVDAFGRLWIAADGLWRMEPGEFCRFGQPEGLPSDAVSDVAADGRGTVWAATEAGLASVSPEGAITMVQDPRLDSAGIENICAAADGTVYGCTASGEAFRIENGAVTEYRTAGELGESVNCVCPDPDAQGKVYLGTLGSAILYGSLSGSTSGLERIEIPELNCFNVLAKQDGVLLAGADNGIARIDAVGGVRVLNDLPINSKIHDILFDREENIWFASSRQGVMKLSPNLFTDISGISDMGERVVNSTWKKDGLLYVGTDTGLVVLDETYQTVRTPVSDLLASARVRAIKEDRSGALWFCSYDSSALVRLSEDGEIRVWNRDNGLTTNYVRTMFERADGTIVVVDSVSLILFREGEIVQTIGAEQGLPSSGVLSVGESDDGTLFLGTNGDGVYVVREGRTEPFSGPADISSGVILQIKNDPGQDVLWLLTSNAAATLSNGEIHTKQGFPQAHFYDILFAPDGGIWLLGANGVYYIDGENAAGEGEAEYTFFSASTGLQHMTTANSRSYVSPEGEACIACTDGILGFQISRTANDHARLMFTVPWLEADGVRILPGADGSFTVPGSTKKLTVCCFALSYALSDSEVSYRLAGFDTGEETVKKSALAPVTYTNLPGGTYRFEMCQAGAEEPWSVTIVKEKTLREKTGFRIGVAAAMLLAAALLTLLLLRRQAVRAAKQQEKERISKELDMAAGIQTSMLPRRFPAFPDRKEFELFASMDPAKEVGGDFYDFFLVDSDHLALVVADVSGKGIPAALFMMVSMTLLRGSTETLRSPAAILSEVNAQLCDGNKNNMFVTVWLGILELSTGRLVFSDGGHEKPVLFHEGVWSFINKRSGVALGLMEPELLELEDEPVFTDQELLLHPGDVLLQYTDGVPEATDTKEQLYGDQRLLDALNAAASIAPDALLPCLRRSIDDFVKGAPQFDDITMLALRFRGGETEGKA